MIRENPLKHPATVFETRRFLSRTRHLRLAERGRCEFGRIGGRVKKCPQKGASRFLRDNTAEVRHEKMMEAAGKLVGSLSVIVPVYNSEVILPKLLDRSEPVLNALGCEHEVVLVNDGSGDQSWRVIQEICAGHPRLTGINLMRN